MSVNEPQSKGKVIKMPNTMQKKEETLPAELLAEYEGYGANFTSDEVTLPFIRIVQKMSPSLVEGDAHYIEGAKAGQLMHTVYQRSFDSVDIIPLRFEHLKLQWRMREHGGGLIASFNPTDPGLPATHKVENQNVVTDDPTSVLEDTLQYVCRVVADEDDIKDLGLAIVSCSRSQLKYARRFNVQLQSKKIILSDGRTIRAPLFSHSYPLSTVQESSNRSGMTQTWHSFKFGEGELITSQDVLKMCIESAKQVNEVKFSQEEEVASSPTSGATDGFEI